MYKEALNYIIPRYDYNYAKCKMTNDEIFESVDMWNEYFEVNFKKTNKDGTEWWTCTNSKYGYKVSCTSELMAHKICLVAMYKIWWSKNHDIKVPNISTIVNRKSDELLGRGGYSYCGKDR